MAWKAYDKDLTCRGKKYEVGQVYEESDAVICEKGMHYCDNPADLMFYHGLIDDDGNMMEISQVEDMAPETTQKQKGPNSVKYCTTKLKIGARVQFGDWVKAAADFVLEKCKRASDASDKNYAKMASSGNYAKMASSGNYAKMASFGNYAQMASSGYSAKMASSGYSAKMASSGYFAQMASSGYSAKMASSGYSAQMASSGYSAQMASSGDYAKMASSGKHSVVAAVGINSKAKAAKGSWITLAEWDYQDNTWVPLYVKTELVDGNRIKADTFYTLKGGEFVEADEA